MKLPDWEVRSPTRFVEAVDSLTRTYISFAAWSRDPHFKRRENKTSLFRPCLCFNPQAPGLHPPDEPGVFPFLHASELPIGRQHISQRTLLWRLVYDIR